MNEATRREQREAGAKKREKAITQNVNFYRIFSGNGTVQMAEDCIEAMKKHVEDPPNPHDGDFGNHCVYYAGQRDAIRFILSKIEKGRQQAHENRTV